MTSCEEYELLLSAQLDNQLSPQETRALEAHLATCPQCRALQAELSLMKEESGGLACEPPEDLTEKIMAQIRLESRPVPPLVSPSHRRWTRYLASAAVLALIVAGASFGGLFTFSEKSTTPDTISAPESVTDDPSAFPSAKQSEPAEEAPDTAAPPPQKGGGNVEKSSPPNIEPPPADTPQEAPASVSPANQDHSQTSEDLQLPAADGESTEKSSLFASGGARSAVEPASQTVAFTQEEAQNKLIAYLASVGIAYDSLKYLGICNGEEGYLFTITVQNGETSTYWVSLADGTVSPIAGLENSPGE